MQTFLPYPDFERSARTLDDRRLGKQRIEAWQIYRALRGVTKGWQFHPAVRMWRGFEQALLMYGYCVCKEWRSRGFSDSLLPQFARRLRRNRVVMPPWMGSQTFHRSHRSNLMRKDPKHYGKRFTTKPGLPYVWPAPRD